MRKIGLVGGLGPESTVEYYRIIISEYRKRADGNAPEMIVYSLNLRDFPAIDQKDKIVDWLLRAIGSLHRAGADFAVAQRAGSATRRLPDLT